MSKTARVYKIELLIRNRGHVSFQTLLEELEVSPATLKRDLEYLRDQLGAPIEYDRFLNGYRFLQEYRGHKHELPGLWFTERELYSLLMTNQLLSGLGSEGAISRHLQPLLDRIHELLGPSESDVKTLFKRVKIIGSTSRPVSATVFELLGEALLKRHRVHLRYHTRARGTASDRDVSPQRLVHYRNTWYLDAWCHTRERLLRFALDAIEDATQLDVKAKDVSLKQVEAEMDGGYGIYAGGHAYWVTLRFSPNAALWVSREKWHANQKGELQPDGSYELSLPYTDPTELAMDILRHTGEVSIVSDTGKVADIVRNRIANAFSMIAVKDH
ncbi:WYL domain-containing protein [Variovorax sp. dw_954]|uniref:helix-turn-helix transcriptional regulator n=1 Tax=Variovorax sp. dw_954 TaxID=2720078 RepID=UPI001BD1D30B|nr:WYL domain-containing protein [Variovorax sp. dw_954]